MGDFIPEVEEGDATAERVPDVYDKLESLIRFQLTEEKSVRDVLIAFGTPTVSVGILDDGNITTTVLGSPGPRRDTTVLESSRSFDNDTLFQAASISKAITALAVIKLCQEGKLDLDTLISQYLNPEQISWISTPQTQALASQISLRLLLSHTAGLCVHGFDGYHTTEIPSLPQILRGDPPANNEPITLFTLPGLRFAYSGGGYTVIQLILETHLQKPFYQIMDEIVLRPLKMSRSTYKALPDTEKNYAPAYLTGKNKSDPDYHVYPEVAAAALWTTPSDLLRAVYAVQRSLESDDFLERKWAKTMLTEVGNNEIGMALGWVAKKGTPLFMHNGSNPPGYNCIVFGYADLAQLNAKQVEEDGDKNENWRNIRKDCGICVMTSSALGSAVELKVLNAITYLKGWPSVFQRPAMPLLDRGSTVNVQAKHWCGDWGPGDWSLVGEDGIFVVRYGSSPALRLVPGALPPHKYDEGNSIDLVADGLELMLRLGWKEGSRMIEIWQNDLVISLERKS